MNPTSIKDLHDLVVKPEIELAKLIANAPPTKIPGPPSAKDKLDKTQQTPEAVGNAMILRLLEPPRASTKTKTKTLTPNQQLAFDAKVAALGGMPKGFRVMHMTSPKGEKFVISNTQTQGSFGYFRLAKRVSDGQTFGAKVLLLDTHPASKLPKDAWLAKRGNKKKPVNFSSWDLVKTEIGLGEKSNSPLVPQAMIKDASKHKLYMFIKLCQDDLIGLHAQVGRQPEERLEIAMGQLANMAEALRDMHAANIVHRDVKLDNMFWTAEGDMYLGDFGLASTLDPDGKSHQLSGSPGYVGPEILTDAGYDHRFDMFGVGASAMAFVLGRNPFDTSVHSLVSILTAWKDFYKRAPKDANGRLVTGSGYAKHTLFGAAIKQLHDLYPPFADLLVNDLCHPDYTKRISAPFLVRQANQLSPPDSERRTEVRRQLATVASQDTERTRRLAIMEAYREVVFPSAK